MRAVSVGLLVVTMIVACDNGPGAIDELDRFCAAATSVRGEPEAVRPAAMMERFGEPRSEEMRSFLQQLGRVAQEEKWAFTRRFAADHGQAHWSCPALEEIYHAGAHPSE